MANVSGCFSVQPWCWDRHPVNEIVEWLTVDCYYKCVFFYITFYVHVIVVSEYNKSFCIPCVELLHNTSVCPAVLLVLLPVKYKPITKSSIYYISSLSSSQTTWWQSHRYVLLTCLCAEAKFCGSMLTVSVYILMFQQEFVAYFLWGVVVNPSVCCLIMIFLTIYMFNRLPVLSEWFNNSAYAVVRSHRRCSVFKTWPAHRYNLLLQYTSFTKSDIISLLSHTAAYIDVDVK